MHARWEQKEKTKGERGGAARGAGRPAASVTPGAKPAGPTQGDKHKQQSLRALLGAGETPAGKRPAVLKDDIISWTALVMEGEEMVPKPQKQVKEGPCSTPWTRSRSTSSFRLSGDPPPLLV